MVKLLLVEVLIVAANVLGFTLIFFFGQLRAGVAKVNGANKQTDKQTNKQTINQTNKSI